MRALIVFYSLLLALLGTSVSAKEYFVALSPFESASVAQAQAQGLLQWAVGLEAGDKVTFLNGYELKTLGRFEVPESAVYRSPRSRLNANRDAVAGLLRFAESAALPSGDTNPSVRGAILLPQLLRLIAMLPTATGNHEVIILASPVYDHPAQPQWSMAGGRFPGDGNIFSSRSQSPYAAADTPDILNGFRIHIAYDESAGTMNLDDYVFRVQRYFTLFIEAQGGELVSFTTDANTALQRAVLNAPAMAHQFEANREASTEETIYEHEVIQDVLSRAELRQAQRVSIGLTWDCAGCDLDLYTLSAHGREVLYYDNPDSREGVVRKEFPLSQQGQNNRGFETVYYTTVVNLEELVIAINFYEGVAPGGVTAELRIDIAGKTYAKELHISANQGNRGQSVLKDIQHKRSSTPQTLLINPLDVIAHD